MNRCPPTPIPISKMAALVHSTVLSRQFLRRTPTHGLWEAPPFILITCISRHVTVITKESWENEWTESGGKRHLMRKKKKHRAHVPVPAGSHGPTHAWAPTGTATNSSLIQAKGWHPVNEGSGDHAPRLRLSAARRGAAFPTRGSETQRPYIPCHFALCRKHWFTAHH